MTTVQQEQVHNKIDIDAILSNDTLSR